MKYLTGQDTDVECNSEWVRQGVPGWKLMAFIALVICRLRRLHIRRIAGTSVASFAALQCLCLATCHVQWYSPYCLMPHASYLRPLGFLSCLVPRASCQVPAKRKILAATMQTLWQHGLNSTLFSVFPSFSLPPLHSPPLFLSRSPWHFIMHDSWQFIATTTTARSQG